MPKADKKELWFLIFRLEINVPLFQFLKIPILLFGASVIIGIVGTVLKLNNHRWGENTVVTALWLFAIALGWAIALLLYAGRERNNE